jgi:hypothetical protein
MSAGTSSPTPQPPQQSPALEASLGGIVTRAIRSHQLWLTVAYVAAMLLLVRAYA